MKRGADVKFTRDPRPTILGMPATWAGLGFFALSGLGWLELARTSARDEGGLYALTLLPFVFGFAIIGAGLMGWGFWRGRKRF